MMNEHETTNGHGFGTTPVFLAAISTILGAIMFLRFGYAVGNVGLWGTLGIIVVGHLVTIPTALAIAEIATNRRVEGGGEYFIISRSFGTTIGSVIGVSLYLSQAVSVAFYMIAFAEAFGPVSGWIEAQLGMPFDARMISVPAVLILIVLILTKGAALGVKALYVVVGILAVALAMFFLGGPVEGFDAESFSPGAMVKDADPFFVVFAICFPAFTGMTAGVGLSGDLANPRKSIPLGTLSATIVGMVAYIAIVVKLSMSAPVEALAADQLIMSRIALWGPVIPIGLACATLSSAIGSILIAPRTLQALSSDGSIPWGTSANRWLSRGVGTTNEPRNATLITGVIAFVIVLAGNVDFVARLISMFFMVTYGALCAISFLEHFAARPSYRPSFRSRWWVSLLGAVMCLFMMFQMDPIFAFLAIGAMVLLYTVMLRSRQGEQDDLAAMFQGVMTQATRYLQLRMQARRRDVMEWRPSVIAVNSRTFDRRSHLDLLRWICSRHGFGTYLHFVRGHLSRNAFEETRDVKQRLLRYSSATTNTVYLDTIVSPSYISALAQSVQVPGVSGLANNTVLFEFSVHDGPDVLEEVAAGCQFVSNTDMSMVVLRHGDFYFGDRHNIHIWLTWNDHHNARLMVLIAYILLGNSEWKDAEITVFAALPTGELEERRAELDAFILEGRLPIADKNLRFLEVNDVESYRISVASMSSEADLVILGMSLETLMEKKGEAFTGHPDLRDTLYVYASTEIEVD